MNDILFLAHRIPYPPNKGDKIRSWHVLKYLANFGDIHLATFIDDPEDRRHIPLLRDMCAATKFVDLSPRRARVRSLLSMLKRAPLTLGYYRNRSMASWVADRLAPGTGIERVFIFSSGMAQYVVDSGSSPHRVVMDFVDVDSDKWAQYARTRKGVSRFIYGWEARHLAAYEARVAAAVDASLLVSHHEAALLKERAPESARRIFAMHNGVDHEYFTPDEAYENPFSPGEKVLLFSGAMDYWANVDAVIWFAREVFPCIRARIPSARFYIIGGKAGAAVQDLASQPGITVAGRVADVRPFLAYAAAVVAPLRIARGVQNKVLEGMAMARPVVATALAAEGIDCMPGRDILVADSAAAFSQSCIDALSLPADHPIGARARSRILADYDWTRNLAVLSRLLDLELPAKLRDNGT